MFTFNKSKKRIEELEQKVKNLEYAEVELRILRATVTAEIAKATYNTKEEHLQRYINNRVLSHEDLIMVMKKILEGVLPIKNA